MSIAYLLEPRRALWKPSSVFARLKYISICQRCRYISKSFVVGIWRRVVIRNTQFACSSVRFWSVV